ncbi:flagellar biosynthesis protein FlhF [Priestia abyssalis]|uniref:flagellar biosynthesis protein FlhF n=1 Tax=Priestia abyssalis TaxID=1221450 RepID=UPI000995B770|nr:flagellar biosynthesis protein FlhF [Priestia abyssalis]
MKVKKYMASSMPEAMNKIRKELGHDAVILNSRVVHTGGVFGFFRKKSIEVIAAIDSQPVSQKKKYPTEGKQVLPPFPASSPNQSENIVQEINGLKRMLQQLTIMNHSVNTQLPSAVERIVQRLKEQEVSGSLIDQLVPSLLEFYYLNKGQATEKKLVHWTKAWLLEKLSVVKPLQGIDFEKKYINVVGPTGVGKTTTLAKMAAQCVLKHQKKVAFITTDTYRISAIDQLKTYANILNVPIEVCYNKEDVEKAKNTFAHFDIILIDTAGRNYRQRQYVDDLIEMFSFNEEMQTHLVLSLTGKIKDMEDVCDQFSSVPLDSFIFTKMDETSTYGSMLNMILKYGKSVSYITNGQNVPDDLKKASPEHIVNLMFGEM